MAIGVARTTNAMLLSICMFHKKASFLLVHTEPQVPRELCSRAEQDRTQSNWGVCSRHTMAELIKTYLLSFLAYRLEMPLTSNCIQTLWCCRLKYIKTRQEMTRLSDKKNCSRFGSLSVEGMDVEKKVSLGRISFQRAQFSILISMARLWPQI